MKKEIVFLVSALLILTLFMVGCTPTGQTGVNKATQAAVGQQIQIRIIHQPVTITSWGLKQDMITQRNCSKCTQRNTLIYLLNPLHQVGMDISTKMAAQAAGNMMPDIVQMDNLYIATYTKNNAIADLYPFVSNAMLDLSDIPESMVKTGIDGKFMGALSSTV